MTRRVLSLGIRLRILGAVILGFWLGAFNGSMNLMDMYLVGMGLLTSIVGWWWTRPTMREEKVITAAQLAAQEAIEAQEAAKLKGKQP